MIEHKLPSYSEMLYKGEPVKVSMLNPNSENIAEIRGMMWGAHKNTRFSEKLLKHGMFYEKTFDNAKRIENQEKLEISKRKAAISKSCETFDACVEEVRLIQNMLSARQKEMALIATEKYSALCIQTAVRGYLAKRKVRIMKASNRIYWWAMLRFIIKRRVRAGRIISRVIKKYMFYKSGKYILDLLKHVKKIHLQFNNILIQRRETIKRYINIAAVDCVQHITLFGITKASKFITMNLLDKDILALRTNKYLNTLAHIYKRNRRLRL